MLTTIFNHRSIRKYKNDPVDEKVLQDILTAGSKASTTGNMQVYSIIATTDPEIKERLSKPHFNQPMVMEAPVMLTFCADFNRFNKWCKYRKATPGYDNFLSFFTAAIDALLAAQNCALEAESHGLGICYLGTTTYNAEEISNTLNLPQHVVPITTVVMGYPDESPELTDRLPVDAVVHRETYRDYTRQDIDTHYQEKEALDSTKQLIKENNLETLAQIFTERRYPKKDNEYFSQQFLDIIKKKGFLF